MTYYTHARHQFNQKSLLNCILIPMSFYSSLSSVFIKQWYATDSTTQWQIILLLSISVLARILRFPSVFVVRLLQIIHGCYSVAAT